MSVKQMLRVIQKDRKEIPGQAGDGKKEGRE